MARNGEVLDGRVLRGQRNRAAIVDALLELLEEGDAKPSARVIAERAGVSVRSVFQHFDDLERLYATVVERQFERLRADAFAFDAGTPFATRLDAFLAHRARRYERIAPVRRATLRAATTSPTLQEALQHAADDHAREVVAVFAPELQAAPNPSDMRAALTVATSWETWERLRTVQRCSAAAARRVVDALVRGVVAKGS